MKSYTIAILIYLGLASACLGAGAVRQDAVDVSLIRLIGSPRDYAGKLVRVVGYLHMQFEGNAIFLHQEDYERGVSMNGLSISAPPALVGELEKLSDTYVLIEGVFAPGRQGEFGQLSGGIVDINRVDSWPATIRRSQKPGQPATTGNAGKASLPSAEPETRRP